MTRIAHISDTHIRNLRYHKEYRQVFKTLFERLREEKIDYIVHCGDIAHSKTHISPEFVKLCSEFLIGLSAVAPTYLILGNHDGNLKNSSREDAISPIVKALNLPNLFLLKNSGIVSIDKKIDLNVFSVFDDSNWHVPANSDSINIALYHGSISNCKTDLGWVMENGDNDITIFDGHDFAFLGDIHKTNQVLQEQGWENGIRKPVVVYPGSTIQQNFGETDDKGFLVWDIKSKDEYSVKHIAIPNPKPFVTIQLTKTGRIPKNTKCPEGARIRLVSTNNLPLHVMKRAISIAEHRFKPERVTYLNRAAGERGNIEEGTNNLAIDNLRDSSVQKTLIEEYLKDYNPTEEQLSKVFKLNKKYNTVIEEAEEVQRNVNWHLGSLSWDNLFNYGEENSIDFDKLNGIVGIFGKNYSGKSSVIDSLLYILFNSTSKNERKNLNIINQNKQDATGQAVITVGNKEYTIKRKSEKYIKKLKGEETLEAKTTVDFYVKDLVTEDIQILNGTTRNETDKIIRKHFGTLEDFLLTSMSSQLGALQFISEGSTKRKEILAKFLDLEIFDKKYKLAKEDATDLRGALRRTEDINYDDEIYEIEKQLMFSENEIKEQNNICEQINKDLMSLHTEKNDLEIKIDSIPADIIDIDKIMKERLLAERNVQTYNLNASQCQAILDNNNQLLDKISKFEETFDVGEVQTQKDQIDQKLLTINKLLTELENAEKLKKLNEKKVKLLGEVPCGDQFKSCKFIKDAHSSKETLVDLVGQVKAISEQKQREESLLNQTDKEKINSHLDKYKKLMEKKSNAEKATMKATLEKGKWENSILLAQNEITRLLRIEEDYNKNKDLIENKESFTLELSKVTNALLKKEQEKADCQRTLLKCYKDNGSLEQKLKSLKEQKQNLILLQEEFSAYDLFMRCMHPNGIAYDIIKKQLPIINEEISKILANVVEFEAFFETDDKHLKIFIKHPKHEPRPVEMGSGAEKTLVAMAIRLALLSVSSLPVGSVFILDEPGTALDAENMDGFVDILHMIKERFKTVLLISHLDFLKDCVDQEIPIEKDNGFAKINI